MIRLFLVAFLAGLALAGAALAQQPVTVAPSPNYGLTSAQTSVAATNLATSGQHVLYDGDLVAGSSSGFFLIFDAASLPGNGTVTPKKCYPVSANQALFFSWSDLPLNFTTGIVIGYSTGASCFSLTAANAGFIGYDYQ
jgi:hypothetical protein